MKPCGLASNTTAQLGSSCPHKPTAAYTGMEPEVPDTLLCPGFRRHPSLDCVCPILLLGYHGAWQANLSCKVQNSRAATSGNLREQAPRPGSASSLVNICRCDSSLRFAFIVTTCLIQSGFTEQTHLPLSLCGDPQPQILTRAWVLWIANLSQVGHNINNLKHVCFFFFHSLFWPHSLWDLSYLTRLNPGPRQWKRRVLTLTCVLTCFSHVWLFATPRTVALQAPLSMGLSRQEYWSGLPLPSPRDLPDQGIELTSLTSPALVGRFFTTSTTWEVP